MEERCRADQNREVGFEVLEVDAFALWLSAHGLYLGRKPRSFHGCTFASRFLLRTYSEGLKHEAHEKLAELNLTEIRKEEFCTKGHNWGKLDVDGKAVIFGGTDSKPFFTIPLPEVSTVQFGKDDVTFEFGGTTDVREGEEMLVGMSFHVPTENEDFPMPLEDDDEVEELRDPERHQKRILPAERFYNVVLPHTDLAAKSERPVNPFESDRNWMSVDRYLQRSHGFGAARTLRSAASSFLHENVGPSARLQNPIQVKTKRRFELGSLLLARSCVCSFCRSRIRRRRSSWWRWIHPFARDKRFTTTCFSNSTRRKKCRWN